MKFSNCVVFVLVVFPFIAAAPSSGRETTTESPDTDDILEEHLTSDATTTESGTHREARSVDGWEEDGADATGSSDAAESTTTESEEAHREARSVDGWEEDGAEATDSTTNESEEVHREARSVDDWEDVDFETTEATDSPTSTESGTHRKARSVEDLDKLDSFNRQMKFMGGLGAMKKRSDTGTKLFQWESVARFTKVKSLFILVFDWHFFNQNSTSGENCDSRAW